nr:aspartic proteinase [Tanacetum cinerariifolium]
MTFFRFTWVNFPYRYLQCRYGELRPCNDLCKDRIKDAQERGHEVQTLPVSASSKDLQVLSSASVKVLKVLRSTSFKVMQLLRESVGESMVAGGRIPFIVSFTIGSKEFKLSPDEYILKIVEGTDMKCVSGFIPLDIPPPRGPACASTVVLFMVIHIEKCITENMSTLFNLSGLKLDSASTKNKLGTCYKGEFECMRN